MRRNMVVQHQILEEVGALPPHSYGLDIDEGMDAGTTKALGLDAQERAGEPEKYHNAVLLIEAGLVVESRDSRPGSIVLSRLTMSGEDLLDALTDTGLWERVYAQVREHRDGVTAEALKVIVREAAKSILGGM